MRCPGMGDIIRAGSHDSKVRVKQGERAVGVVEAGTTSMTR
jgi:hypothetical protein